MGGMEPMVDLIATFQEIEGSIHVSIPCKSIKTSGFLVDCELITLTDKVEMNQTFPRLLALDEFRPNIKDTRFTPAHSPSCRRTTGKVRCS
jgi:hypothetical protein